jgi:phenylacetate-coenzyme A ligase PaaK-like adenylate-forming protein
MAGLLDYAPEVLVLPLGVGLSLADQKQRGLGRVPNPATAIVVLTSLGDSALEDHHRELLWKAFRVPIFEQLRGWDGAVIARECEVHDGLHIEDAAAIVHRQGGELLVTQLTTFTDPIVRARSGLAGDIETAHCECGAETPRLKNLTSLGASVAAAVGRR